MRRRQKEKENAAEKVVKGRSREAKVREAAAEVDTGYPKVLAVTASAQPGLPIPTWLLKPLRVKPRTHGASKNVAETDGSGGVKNEPTRAEIAAQCRRHYCGQRIKMCP